LNAPYFVEDDQLVYPEYLLLTDETELVFEAGVNIVFSGQTGLLVQKGRLLANGTADNKVVLTGLHENPGSWEGVDLVDAEVNLAHLDILWGGAPGAIASLDGALVIYGLGDKRPKVLDNVHISGSPTCGLNIYDDDLVFPVPPVVTYGDNARDYCGP